MVLLVAGYDTTGTTLAWTCYALSKNPDVQDKLRAEIEEITDGNLDKKLSYDDLLGMTYLDQVISETLRFYNPAGLLKRTTTKDYSLPGTDITIPKDTNVWINSIGNKIHALKIYDQFTLNTGWLFLPRCFSCFVRQILA